MNRSSILHKLAQFINPLQIIFPRFNFFSLQLDLNQLRTKTVCLLKRKTQFKRAFSKLYIRNYVATSVHIISGSHLKSTELQAQFSLQIARDDFIEPGLLLQKLDIRHDNGFTGWGIMCGTENRHSDEITVACELSTVRLRVVKND